MKRKTFRKFITLRNYIRESWYELTDYLSYLSGRYQIKSYVLLDTDEDKAERIIQDILDMEDRPVRKVKVKVYLGEGYKESPLTQTEWLKFIKSKK